MKNMIKEFYEIEQENNVDNVASAASIKTISINVPIDTAHMLKAIAGRFGTSMSPMVSDILNQVAQDLFSQLTIEDKLALAVQADQESEEHLNKNPNIKKGSSKRSFWRGILEFQKQLDLQDKSA